MQGIKTSAYAAANQWLTYTNTTLGYSLQYPEMWMVYNDSSGQHIGFHNLETGSSIVPYIQTVGIGVTTYLAQPIPQNAISVQRYTIDGLQVSDYTMPYQNQVNSIQGIMQPQSQTRFVNIPIEVGPNKSTIFEMIFTQPTLKTGQLTTTVAADSTVFEKMLHSLKFTQQSKRFAPYLVTPCPDRVCWANSNWQFTDYQDSGTVNEGEYQPNFQCAEFVSRALSQNNLIPGLYNGGFRGTTAPYTGSVTGDSGSGDDFGSYHFDHAPFTSDYAYDLLWTGTRGSTGPLPSISGLYEYLIDSGIGQDIGSNVNEAQPGDVVFFYEGDPSPNRHHVMITVSQPFKNSNNNWDILLDGHNTAAYQSQLSAWMNNAPIDIIHIKTSIAGVQDPTLSGPKPWNSGLDGYGHMTWNVPTTNLWGSSTNWAKYSWSSLGLNTACMVAVYVPEGNANANPTVYEVETRDGIWHRQSVNQNNVSGWVMLYAYGTLPSSPIEIAVSNNDGNTIATFGTGDFAFNC